MWKEWLGPTDMVETDAVVDRIRRRLASAPSPTDADSLRTKSLPSVATVASIVAAESAIGLKLPPLLCRMYTDIANGGFGPGYGLIGVAGGATDDIGNSLVDLYSGSQSAQFRKRFPTWPTGIVRFCYWGCAMYSAIDCLTPNYAVYHFEPNPDEADLGFANCLIPHNRSFDEYVAAWLDDHDLMNDVFPAYADET